MSEIPSETVQQQNGEVLGENTAQNNGAPQKTSLFYFNQPANQWFMLPEYQQFFYGQSLALQELRDVINEKWNEQQIGAYLKFIDDFLLYINNYIFQFQVGFWQDFQYWRDNCLIHYNQTGYELYEKQLSYCQKLINGQPIFEKKKKKGGAQQPQPPKPQIRKPVEEKQKIIIRQNDPQINLQKLWTTNWNQTYVNLEILRKQNINIVFIGHVDSGKSTLTGNIIKELKEIDEQELLKTKQDSVTNKMASWEQAGISDVIPEERQDGKTRQCAKLNFMLKNNRFTLFDAPGHKNYVPNMIMGACQADVALLIISSKEGEFESGFEKDGQTKEHAMLAKALGVTELFVGVTKMALSNFSQARFDYIKTQVTPYLQNNCGFHNVTFIPLDSIENLNIHSRMEDSWYKGPCLIEYLDQIHLPQRNPSGPLRIPVIDRFRQAGIVCLYGKIESGTIIEDQIVTILPQRNQLLIKQIYNAKDQRLPFACAGQNVKLRIKDKGDDTIMERGSVLCNNMNYCQQSAQFKANITILQLPQQKKLVSSGYQCVMHMHSITEEIQIGKVEAKFDKQTGKKVTTTFLKSGEKGVCVVKSERPICLEKYEFMPSLGRFTIRDEGKTVGYGEITAIKPAKKLLEEQKAHLMSKHEDVKGEDQKEKKKEQKVQTTQE